MKRTLDYNKPFKLKGRKYKAYIRELRAINKATANIRGDLKAGIVYTARSKVIRYEELMKLAYRPMRTEGTRIQEVKTT